MKISSCSIGIIEVLTYWPRAYLAEGLSLRTLRNSIIDHEMARIVSWVREKKAVLVADSIKKKRLIVAKRTIAEGGLGGTLTDLAKDGRSPTPDLDWSTRKWRPPATKTERDMPLLRLAMGGT